jgi:hypothetical protein
MTWDLSAYQPVEDRLREFWQRYPSGRITTTLLFHEDQHYIVQAHIYRGDELRDTPPVATGLAHDSFDQLPPNMRQSALEVCETSAIGRALANMGFAPKGKRPSREEMHKATAASHESAVVPPAETTAGPPAAGGEPSAPVPYGEDGTGAGLSFGALAKAAGGRAKARELINRVCDLEYSAATVGMATTEELEIAFAALQEANA